MLSALIQKLGLSRGARPPWLRALGERGVDRRILDALEDHADLEGAWSACERLDWALVVAIRARVEPALLVRGWEAVAGLAGGWTDARGALDETAALLDAFTRGEVALEALVEGARARALVLVERAPWVAAALAKAHEADRWRVREQIQRAANEYDAAHALAHARLARTFRRSIPFGALRFALEGPSRSPYR